MDGLAAVAVARAGATDRFRRSRSHSGPHGCGGWHAAWSRRLRIVLPLALVIATGYLIVVLVMPLAAEEGWGAQVAVALAAAGCLFGVASFLLVVALKWLLVGRYRPRAAPMWTLFVWLSEAVTNLYESLAVPNFLDFLRGTPMLPWALRLLGARIGRGVYLDTTDLTEFDCVTIGDEAELNGWCGPQTHLFEDRVMKIGTVEIGAGSTIGPRSTHSLRHARRRWRPSRARSPWSRKANVCPPQRAGKVRRQPRLMTHERHTGNNPSLARTPGVATAGPARIDPRRHIARACDRQTGIENRGAPRARRLERSFAGTVALARNSARPRLGRTTPRPHPGPQPVPWRRRRLDCPAARRIDRRGHHASQAHF